MSGEKVRDLLMGREIGPNNFHKWSVKRVEAFDKQEAEAVGWGLI